MSESEGITPGQLQDLEEHRVACAILGDERFVAEPRKYPVGAMAEVYHERMPIHKDGVRLKISGRFAVPFVVF